MTPEEIKLDFAFRRANAMISRGQGMYKSIEIASKEFGVDERELAELMLVPLDEGVDRAIKRAAHIYNNMGQNATYAAKNAVREHWGTGSNRKFMQRVGVVKRAITRKDKND